MRLPWIVQHQSRRSATRRKRPAPLRVRRLERRRVLDAAVADLMFAPPDVDGSTAVHDSNEGTEVTITADASGSGVLSFNWKATKDATVVAQSNDPVFKFTPLDDGNYSVTLNLMDSAESVASRTESLVVHNVRPVLVVASDQMVEEGTLLDLSAVGAPPLGLFLDQGTADTHTATVDWGDGTAAESPTIFAAAGSGALGGTHTYTDDGVYKVIVTVADDDGGSDTQSFFVTVGNVEPTATLANDGPVAEGSSATVSFSGQFDPSSEDTAAGFHYAYDLDNNGTFDVGDGTYAGSNTNDTQMVSAALLADGPGTHTVKARIIDKDDGFTDYATTITIDNVAPKLLNLAAIDDTIDEGQTATIKMTIDDPGAMDVFSVDVDWNDDAPGDTISGLGISGVNGTIGGTTYQWDAQTRRLTVSHRYDDDNPTATSSDKYAIALTVRDDDLGMSDPYYVDVLVSNVRPVLVVATDKTVDEGELLDLSGVGAAPIGLFIDDGILDTHTATVDWGDGSAPESPTIFAGPGTGALGATHTYQDDGTYTVTVTVTDDDGGSDTQELMATVLNVDPSIDTLAITTPINEGKSATLSGTYSDPGVLDTHELDVDWDGDNVFDQTVSVTGGTFSLAHQFPDDNPTATPSDTFTVHVRLRDDDSGSDTDEVDLTVNNVRPVLVVANDQMVDEGQLLDLSAIGAPPIGLFIDDGKLDSHMATVDWGDGSAVESPTIFSANGSGALGASHTYADDGVYTVTVTVTDDDGGFDSQSFLVRVENVAPMLGVTPSADMVNEGSAVGFDATFSDPGFDNLLNPGTEKEESFTYDLDWGDGRDAIVGMSVADTNGMPGVDSTGMFSGSHIYADDGTYTVNVTIHDDDNGSVSQQFMVTVRNADPTLTLPGGDQIVNEGSLLSLSNLGTFSDPGFDNLLNPGTEKEESFTYDLDWGDGRDAIVGMSVADTNGMPGVDSAGMFDGSHTYADDGVYLVTVTIHDDNEGSDTKTFQVMVNNVQPTLDVTPSATSINEGQTVLFDATFSDPGFDNLLNPGGATAESFRYFLNWGDGRDEIGSLAVADSNGMPGVPSTGMFDDSHTYADDGVYTVTIRLADDDMSGNFAAGVAGVDFVEKTFAVTVHNVAPTLTGTTNVMVDEGSAFTLTGLGVGLEDPGFDNPLNPTTPSLGDPLRETFTSFAINWGDGSADTAVTINNINDRTSGSPGVTTKALFTHDTHAYADDGDYTVTIRLADDNMLGDFVGGVAGVDYVDLTFTITVKNVAPTLALTGNQTVDESQDLVLPVLATFTDPGFDNALNPSGATTESFAYFLDWGDGRDQIGSLAVADLDGMPGTPSSGSFGGSHNYADNGVYTVTIRLADDDMTANFATGVAGVDYVQQTLMVTVNNLGPSFVPQPGGGNFQGDDVSKDGLTTIRLSYNDPGYDNPLNTLDASNGGETVETFNHVVQWGDGTVDAIHQYTSGGVFTVTVTMTPHGGVPQVFSFASFNSSNPVLTLASSQQLNDPSVVPTLVTYVVNWGDGHLETFQLSLLNPGLPVASNGLTTLVATTRSSGNATTLTTGSAEVQHRYLGPPDPLHPTADITIALAVYDDDGASVADAIAVANPGIETNMVAIDTTPDVPRLDLTQQPMVAVYVPDQGGLAQLFQVPDVRGGGGEVAATSERYLELRIVYPDGTESKGYRILDEALADLRAFFKTLPDGPYAIYLVRTENHYERLVIEVNVRRGRLIDVSDDSEGTRDRPPTDEGEAPQAVPLEQNPNLQAVPGADRQGNSDTRRQEEQTRTADQDKERISLPPSLLVSLSATALAAQPWSQRVDHALAEADETAWKRLRRAGRHMPRTLNPPGMRTVTNLDYNRI